MNAICLIVAGVIEATLPVSEFTLEWRHSIEKTRWVEHYRIDGDALVLVEASVEGNGAGMQPSPDARLHDGTWVWHPNQLLPAVVLAASEFGGDYKVCTLGRCRPLRQLRKPASRGPVELRACASNGAGGSHATATPRP